MRPYPRIRKTIKWGGAAVTLLLVVAWIGSGWCVTIWQTPDRRFRVTVESGRIGFAEMFAAQPVSASGWHFASNNRPFNWMWGRYTARAFDARWVPLWTLTLATILPTGIAWRLDALARRRERRGLCPKCNYDRAGLAAGVKCPECGTSPDRI